jgi:hypothetical protein
VDRGVAVRCTKDPVEDCGSGVRVERRYLDGNLEGIAWWHTCNGIEREDFMGTRPPWDDGWFVVQSQPLTLSPSILCLVCRFHGHIVSTWKTTLADLEAVLPGVLEELRAIDSARRPFVVVDDVVTKRFVQFARIVKSHSGDAERGIAPLGAMAFDVPALGVHLQGFGNDPLEGARRAASTLRQWLPDDAELRVTLDGDPLD